jgi:CDP-glycerol glycerophosphotransferase (TagB/SpsB family)
VNILLVSVGKEEYQFERKLADFLREIGWRAQLVTLGRYNVDFKTAPADTTVVEEKIPDLFAAPQKRLPDLDNRVHQLEKEFQIPCIRRLYFTDRIHRPRLHHEWQSAQVLWHYFQFWREYLQKEKFDIGFMEHGGEMVRWGAFHNCRKLGIPLYQSFFCPLPGRFWPLNNMEHHVPEIKWQTREEISPELRTELNLFVQNLREGRKDFVRIRKMDFQWSMPFLLLRAVYRKYLEGAPQYKRAMLWEYTRESFLKITRKHLMKIFYYEPRPDEKFIFFPLHYIDDAQIVIRAPEYYNQFSLLEILANSLPYGYKLYVKEHPSLIGAFPFSEIRRLLRKCPNVRMINPLFHPHKLIRWAQAVCTINSTTGFEAMLFKKPLLVFGKTYYRDAGFSINVTELGSLPDKIRDALDWEPPDDEQILNFLAKLYLSSFPGEPMCLDSSEENARSTSRALVSLAKLT